MARLNFEQDLIMKYEYFNSNDFFNDIKVYELKLDILEACNKAEEYIKKSSNLVKIEIWRKVTPEIAIKEFTFVKED